MTGSNQSTRSTATGKAAVNLHAFFRPATGQHHRATTVPPEIIIIDSDEDEISVARPNLKRTLDLELQDQPPLSTRINKKGKAVKSNEVIASFGTPVLLSGPSIAKPNSAPGKVAGSSSSLSPLVNRESFTEPLSRILHVHADEELEDESGQHTSTPTSDIDLNFYTTEWNTGDDEHGAQDFDEPIDIDIEDFEPALGASCENDLCPVCGERYTKASVFQFQEHVNECLDRSLAQASQTQTHFHSYSPPVTPNTSHTLSSVPAVQISSQNNAFSLLMSSHKENEAWKEAEVAEKSTFKANKGRRKAPFYKVLQGMPIAVDAFRYGKIPDVTAYFLTHAHSDHYTSLSSSWKNGPIYCSQITANLIIHMLSVDPKWVHPLPMDVASPIPNTGGVCVTLIDANHCPGSCIFLYEGPQTVNAGDSVFKSSSVGSNKTFRYLHCGDFRASPRHVQHPAVRGKRVDHIYLDTTYLDPTYCFPPQPQVISACAELATRIGLGSSGETKEGSTENWFMGSSNGRSHIKPESNVLFVIGTYSVGKERIVSAVAKSLQTKIYCDARKAAIIRCQSDPDLESMLTEDPLEAAVHIVPLGLINPERLKLYANRWKEKFDKVVGFRPTGWTYRPPAGTNTHPSISSVISPSRQRTFTWSHLKLMKGSNISLQVYAVPYSEHSSFFELTCFALSLDWGKMIATVNVGSEKSRTKMNKWFEKWDKARGKGNIDVVEHRCVDYW